MSFFFFFAKDRTRLFVVVAAAAVVAVNSPRETTRYGGKCGISRRRGKVKIDVNSERQSELMCHVHEL